jgi:hypothetical protein
VHSNGCRVVVDSNINWTPQGLLDTGGRTATASKVIDNNIVLKAEAKLWYATIFLLWC